MLRGLPKYWESLCTLGRDQMSYPEAGNVPRFLDWINECSDIEFENLLCAFLTVLSVSKE